MSDPIKIPLTEAQKHLLQSKELTTYLEPEMKLALLAIGSKGDCILVSSKSQMNRPDLGIQVLDVSLDLGQCRDQTLAIRL